MNFDEFTEALASQIAPSTVFNNPGGGESRILEVRRDLLIYERGSSSIRVGTDRLFEAYDSFRGRRMESSDLRHLWPEVFDSAARPAGHSCNATMLMMLLGRLGLAGPIQGHGKRGSPFFVDVRA